MFLFSLKLPTAVLRRVRARRGEAQQGETLSCVHCGSGGNGDRAGEGLSSGFSVDQVGDMLWLWCWMSAGVSADQVLGGIREGRGRGDGRNGAGELWRLFASGQVRSAGADVCRNCGGSVRPGERV